MKTNLMGVIKRASRRLYQWAWARELVNESNRQRLQMNVNEDAQSLIDALMRGETADAFCGYGRDGQASNYRDELKWSLHELKKHPAS